MQNSSTRNIIFYDGKCPLCHRTVRFLLKADKKKRFYFAPLEGETAQEKLAGLHLTRPDLDTLVLFQGDGQFFIEGKGALRILWLLGGKYRLIGWLSFLPSSIFDRIYRSIARHRYRLFTTKGSPPIDPTRFLP